MVHSAIEILEISNHHSVGDTIIMAAIINELTPCDYRSREDIITIKHIVLIGAIGYLILFIFASVSARTTTTT